MQERKRNLVAWKVVLAIAVFIGFIFYETQVYQVGYETRIGLIAALLFGFLTYGYLAFSLLVGPYVAITAIEENDAKVAAILIAVIFLMASLMLLIFWGVILKEAALIGTGVGIGIVVAAVVFVIFKKWMFRFKKTHRQFWWWVFSIVKYIYIRN